MAWFSKTPPPSASGWGAPPPAPPPPAPGPEDVRSDVRDGVFFCPRVRQRSARISAEMFRKVADRGRAEDRERRRIAAVGGEPVEAGAWGRKEPSPADRGAGAGPRIVTPDFDGETLLGAICDWPFMMAMNHAVKAEKGAVLSETGREQPATLMDREGFLPTGIVRDRWRDSATGEEREEEALYVLVRSSARLETPPYVPAGLWNQIQSFFNLHPETRRELPLVLVWVPQDTLKLIVNHAYFQGAVAGGVVEQAAFHRAEGPVPMDVQADDDDVIRQARAWIRDAIARHASDIHVEPGEKVGRIRIRVNGLLEYLARDVSPRVVSQFVTWVKALADMDISDNRRPLDGSLRISYTDAGASRVLDVRVSAIPVVGGQKMVLRLLDPDAFGKLSRKGLEGAIWDPRLLRLFKTALETRDGIVLVTGPTGSGKTTTLNIALFHLLRPEICGDSKNIVTIEDPVEYTIPGANQTQVNDAAGVTFAATLRSLLRQDPDIMLVGEIRDSETAQIAVQAALTGHLILATLHTNDALGSVSRMQDLGVTPFLLGSTLRLVQAQRLVRSFCPECGRREENRISPADLPGILSHSRLKPFLPALVAPEAAVFRPGGCLRCGGSGFAGRVAVMEMAATTPDLVSAIERNLPARELEEVARRTAGFRPMVESGVDMVAAGVTSLEEIASISLKDLASVEE